MLDYQSAPKKSMYINVWCIYLPGDSSRDLFIPQLEVPYPLKGSLIHPEKVTKNCQVHETPPELVNKDSFCGEVL